MLTNKSMPMPPVWLSLTVGVACLVATMDLPYGYYQMLRLIVTAYAGYLSAIYFKNSHASVGWALLFFAVLYNPLFPIAMSKGMHSVFNVATAVVVTAELLNRSKGGLNDLKMSDASEMIPNNDVDIEILVGPLSKSERLDYTLYMLAGFGKMAVIGIFFFCIFYVWQTKLS